MESPSNSYIQKRIKITTRNKFIRILLLTIVTILLTWGSSNYLYNLFLGPFPVSQEEIANLGTQDFISKSFVKFVGNDPFNTGYSHIQQTTDEYTNKVTEEENKGDYILFLAPQSILLVKTPVNHLGNTYQGFLKRIQDNKIANSVIAKIENEVPETRGHYLALMLDTTDQPNIIIPILLLCSYIYIVWSASKTIKEKKQLNNNPLIEQIKKYGELEKIIPAIDDEIKNLENSSNQIGPWYRIRPKTNKKIIITKSWLIQNSLFETNIIRLNEIVWVYVEEFSYSVNLIPIVQTKALKIKTSRLQTLDIQIKKSELENLVVMLGERFPWIIFGFKSELENLWKTQPEEFLRLIETRKNESKKKKVNLQTK